MPERARPVRAKVKRRAPDGGEASGECMTRNRAMSAIAAIDFSRVLVRVSCAPVKLRVRVADDLVLEAGVCENDGIDQIVHPPQVTLFRQVLDYLRAKPDPPTDFVTIELEAAAAALAIPSIGARLVPATAAATVARARAAGSAIRARSSRTRS
jgi:hypothetical protein